MDWGEKKKKNGLTLLFPDKRKGDPQPDPLLQKRGEETPRPVTIKIDWHLLTNREKKEGRTKCY